MRFGQELAQPALANGGASIPLRKIQAQAEMSRASKVDRILKAIPDGEWIKAVDLKKTGIRAQEIGALISHHLLNEFIEHMGQYEYRRLIRIMRHDSR